jgi:hypothetical protein
MGSRDKERATVRSHLKPTLKSSLALSKTQLACVAPNATTLNSQEERKEC